MSKQKIVRSAVSFFIGLGLMLPGVSFGQTFTISTTARFVDDEVPSSRSNDFDVVLTGFSPGSRTCRVRGLPADRAVNVGNCRWTQYVEGEFALLLITLNWKDAEDADTPAIFGEFILLNDLGTGQWVRFFTSDGTSAGVVGSASGAARYDPIGLPPLYTHTLFVDGAVATSGDGTSGRPFKTISEAARAARPSTAIHVAAGTYTETVRVLTDDIGIFGTARNAVTISNPGDFAVLCNTVDNFALYSVTLIGKNGLGLLACAAEFVNIVVTESSQHGIIVSNKESTDPTTASSLTLRDTVVSANSVGVVVNHTSSLSAYGTTFTQNTVHGVQVTSSGAVLLEDCYISKNGQDGFNWKNTNSGTGQLTVADSAISDNARAGVVLLNAVNGTIERSEVRENGQVGISVSSADASSLTLRDTVVSANGYSEVWKDAEHGGLGVVVNHTSSLFAYGTMFTRNAVDGVRVTSSGSVLLKDCDIVENRRDGFNWKNTNPGAGQLTVIDSAISDNARAGVVLLNAVSGTIDRSQVRGNGTSGQFNGLEFERQWTGQFTVSNSTFMNNTQYGIFVGSGSVTLDDNLLEGNGQNGLGIDQAATTRQPITAVLRNNIIRDHPGTNRFDGLGLQLWQQGRDSRPMRVILDGGNVFDNNATHVSCSSQDNPFNLTCRGNTFSPNFDRAITSCNLNPNICSSVTCPALCS